MTSNNEPGLDKVKSWTQLMVTICFAFSFSLGIILILQQHTVDIENKTYSLTFKDDMTTFDIGNGRLTLTAHNNQPYSHQLKFYGLVGANTNFSKTNLSNQDGGIIDDSKIVLDPSYIAPNQVDFTTVVDLSIENSKEAGTFNGWLIFLKWPGENFNSTEGLHLPTTLHSYWMGRCRNGDINRTMGDY